MTFRIRIWELEACRSENSLRSSQPESSATSVICSARVGLGVGGMEAVRACGGMPSLETWDEGWFKDGAIAQCTLGFRETEKTCNIVLQ